jgi:hypothetical protein
MMGITEVPSILVSMIPKELSTLWYKQAGVVSSDIATSLLIVALITGLLSAAFDLYVSARQRRMYGLTKVPKSVVQAVENLTQDECQSLVDALRKKEGAAATTGSKSKFGSTQLLSELEARFQKAQSYGLDKSTYGLMNQIFMIALNVLLTISGFMPYLFDLSRTILESYLPAYAQNEIAISAVFMTLYYLQSTVIGIPFSLYYTFVIEERHGFNKQTLGGFFKDMALQSLLMAALGKLFGGHLSIW